MKKCVDGEYIEMTPEEITAFQEGENSLEPTLEERLTALENLVSTPKDEAVMK